MRGIETEYLFTMRLDVAAPIPNLGQTPFGQRLIARVTGGTVEGPRLNGKVHDGGGDWLLGRADGALQLDVRLTIEADDGGLIYVTYRGVRHGPAEVMTRLGAGEAVDPSEYYFRMAPFFETASEKHGWLNRIVAVGTGHRLPTGPVYEVHMIR